MGTAAQLSNALTFRWLAVLTAGGSVGVGLGLVAAVSVVLSFDAAKLVSRAPLVGVLRRQSRGRRQVVGVKQGGTVSFYKRRY